jgi:hypothetical protein
VTANIIAFVVGAIIGCIVAGLILRGNIVGKLKIDSSDPIDGPYMFLELAKDLSCLLKKRLVLLKVDSRK